MNQLDNAAFTNIRYRKRHKYWLPFLLLLLGFISVNQWSSLPIGNTTSSWLLWFLILFFIVKEKKESDLSFRDSNYKIVGFYLLWAAIGILRGYFEADNYWEYKNLVSNSFSLLLPLIVFALSAPETVRRIYRVWMIYGLIAYALFFYWQVDISAFYLAPVYFVGCFLPLIKHRWWRLLIFVLLIGLLTYHYQDNRSASIKAAVALTMALACWGRKFISNKLLKLGAITIVVATIILLVLGITGTFNIFSDTSSKYEGRNVLDEGDSQADISSDTRTFIYVEVLSSAVNNNYVFLGRTPARGNDTEFFYSLADDLQSTRAVKNLKHERPSNEVCFPNIFTWLGLIGMLLYVAIYLYAGYLGLWKSNSYYLKVAGFVVLFNFAYGWVENTTKFDIQNIVYWTFISLCLSSKFRTMDDETFKNWLNSIFSKKTISKLSWQ